MDHPDVSEELRGDRGSQAQAVSSAATSTRGVPLPHGTGWPWGRMLVQNLTFESGIKAFAVSSPKCTFLRLFLGAGSSFHLPQDHLDKSVN